MLSKARIKLINQLKQKKYREINKMFFAEGSINVIDFIKSKTSIVELFATEDWINNNESIIADCLTTTVSFKDLKRISALSNPSDVLAIFELPNMTTQARINNSEFVIALDDISDPGNLGTIIRTADWFGIKHIFCSKNTVDAFNPKVVQATMGSLSRVKINYSDLDILFQKMPDDIPIYGAVLNGISLNKIEYQTNGIILIGSEAHGISAELLKYVSHKITIPSKSYDSTNKAESLNASIANAIICYALCAQ